MRCDECRALLRSLVGGDLDGRTRREVARHLLECEDCAAQVGEDDFWDDALLRHLDHELPPDLREEILGDLAEIPVETPSAASRLDRLDRRSQWRLVWWSIKRDFTEPARLLRTVAVAAAVLAAAFWWSSRSVPEQPYSRSAPVLRIEQQAATDMYENPPTGGLTLSGRLI